MEARVERVSAPEVAGQVPQAVGAECNAWLIGDDDEVIVIDPGEHADAVLEAAGDREILAVICTHGHDRHVAAAVEVAERDEAPVALHRSDLLFWRMTYDDVNPEIEMAAGGRFDVSDVALEVIHTPGHSPGSVSLYCEDLEVVFTGDTLAAVGPVPHEGEYPDFAGQLTAIGERLLDLPPATRVLPGHGEETTIGDAAKRFDGWVTAGPDHSGPVMEQLGFEGMPRRLYSCTPTRLSTWLDCPRRYRMSYLDRPAPPKGPPWAHNSVGASVHNALAGWWRLPLPRRTVAGGRRAGRDGLDQRGLRERRAVGPVPGLGARPGGTLRRRPRPGRRAGRRGADGGDAHRRDRGLRADRPSGREAARGRRGGHRARHRRLQDRPPRALGGRRAQFARACPVRDRRLAHAAPRLPAGRAASSAERPGARLDAHRREPGAAPAAGRGGSRGVRRGR